MWKLPNFQFAWSPWDATLIHSLNGRNLSAAANWNFDSWHSVCISFRHDILPSTVIVASKGHKKSPDSCCNPRGASLHFHDGLATLLCISNLEAPAKLQKMDFRMQGSHWDRPNWLAAFPDCRTRPAQISHTCTDLGTLPFAAILTAMRHSKKNWGLKGQGLVLWDTKETRA